MSYASANNVLSNYVFSKITMKDNLSSALYIYIYIYIYKRPRGACMISFFQWLECAGPLGPFALALFKDFFFKYIICFGA